MKKPAGEESSGGLGIPSASTMAVPSASGLSVPSASGNSGEGKTRPYILQCDRATTHKQMVRSRGVTEWLDELYDLPLVAVKDSDPIPVQIETAEQITVLAGDLFKKILEIEANSTGLTASNFNALVQPIAIPLSQNQKQIEDTKLSKQIYGLVGLRFEREGVVHERIGMITLVRTIFFAVVATALALLVCYPIAYKLALATPPEKAVWLFLGLLIPYAIVELMRIYAWTSIIDNRGLLNTMLDWLGIINMQAGEAIQFKRSALTVFMVVVYTYVLFMVFPIYNVMSTLDKNQLEAAKDLGSGSIRIHWRIIIPHTKPGIAVGCIATFMLAAGAFSVPRIISRGLQSEWFAQTIYNKFFESENSNVGAAYSFAYTLLCFLIVGLFHVHHADPIERLCENSIMTSQRLLTFYTWAFLAFMFAPLLLMIVSSFNNISPPSVTDWRGFTGKWYSFFWVPEEQLRADEVLRALDRERFVQCFQNSILIAMIVVPLSLTLGLSGAVLLTRWRSRANGILWWVLLSPMLAPGVVLGLSALVFWGRLGVGAGLFTIVVAQTTFIAGYPLLILMARLQRQPVELEEAALDLGASPFKVFLRITLPFLVPALLSAGVISFLASMENFNTTMFAKGGACTFATEIGAMARNPNGHPPVINSVGTIIIVLTVVAAVAHTFLSRRESR